MHEFLWNEHWGNVKQNTCMPTIIIDYIEQAPCSSNLQPSRSWYCSVSQYIHTQCLVKLFAVFIILGFLFNYRKWLTKLKNLIPVGAMHLTIKFNIHGSWWIIKKKKKDKLLFTAVIPLACGLWVTFAFSSFNNTFNFGLVSTCFPALFFYFMSLLPFLSKLL